MQTTDARWGWTAATGLVGAAIIVPFLVWGARLEAWAHDAAVGVSLALLALDVFLPVPSSLLAVSLGHEIGPWLGVLGVWSGLMAGCAMGYATGRLLGPPGLRRLVGVEGLARAQAAFESRRGVVGIGATRAVPVLSEGVVLFAGAAGMQPRAFFTTAALANLGVAVVYAGIGAVSAAAGTTGPAIAAGILGPVVATVLVPRLVVRGESAHREV